MLDSSEDGKLYYFEASGRRKAILIFEPGHPGADGSARNEIHIYEHVSSLPRGELSEELRKRGQCISWKFTEDGGAGS